MRRALFLSGVALFMLAALNLWTWRQLTAERARASSQREQVSSRGDPQFASRGTPSPMHQTDVAAATAMPPEEASPASASPEIVTGVDPEVLLKDPDYLRAWRTQTRSGIDAMYPDLAKALKLTPEMANRLQELLVDHQLATMHTSVRIIDGHIANPDQEHEWEQRQRKEQDEIATLLGPRRMTAFDEYKDNLRYRAEVNILRAGMGSGPDGMRDDQVEALIPIYRAAVEREDANAPQGTVDPAPGLGPIDPVQWAADNAQSRERDKALHARIIDGARSVLDPRQLAQMELGFRKQEELAEAAAILMQKGMLETPD